MGKNKPIYEFKLHLRAKAPGALLGLFPFSSETIEIVEAPSMAEAISKVQGEFSKTLEEAGLSGEAILEVLNIEEVTQANRQTEGTEGRAVMVVYKKRWWHSIYFEFYLNIPLLRIETRLFKESFERLTYDICRIRIQFWRWTWEFQLYRRPYDF